MMNSTTQTAAQPTTDYFVTECPEHGSKVTADFDSFKVYVYAAQGCDMLTRGNMMGAHMPKLAGIVHDAHHADGTSCWTCCERMVIDPYGLLDH